MINDLAQIAAQSPHAAHWSAQQFEAELKNPAAIILTEQLEGRPAAFIALRHAAGAAEVTNFAVQPAHQRRGLGAKLLAAALAALKQKGVCEVTLEANQNNAAALALYAKNGFEQVSVRKKFYNGAQHALLLKKLLL